MHREARFDWPQPHATQPPSHRRFVSPHLAGYRRGEDYRVGSSGRDPTSDDTTVMRQLAHSQCGSLSRPQSTERKPRVRYSTLRPCSGVRCQMTVPLALHFGHRILVTRLGRSTTWSVGPQGPAFSTIANVRIDGRKPPNEALFARNCSTPYRILQPIGLQRLRHGSSFLQ